jgi:6-phosphogluconolactonase (cycloisomerase 2 family)
VKTPIKATTTAASAALAALLTIGTPSMSTAETFLYVSDAEDGTIDAYAMDAKTGALSSIGKAEAGKLVMPMAVAPNKKFLYAVVRSQPTRVAKRTVAKAKPKRTPVKEVVRKEAVAPVVETLVDTTEIREESEPKPPSLI